jgi:hypothetical protein
MGSRKEDLGPFRILLNIKDVSPDAFSLPIYFARDLFLWMEDRLGPSDASINISFSSFEYSLADPFSVLNSLNTPAQHPALSG